MLSVQLSICERASHSLSTPRAPREHPTSTPRAGGSYRANLWTVVLYGLLRVAGGVDATRMIPTGTAAK